MRALSIALILVATAALPAVAHDDVTLVWRVDQKPHRVEVVGIPASVLAQLKADHPSSEALGKLFVVRLLGKKTPILGTCRYESDQITFEPRFPFEKDTKYAAALTLPRASDPYVYGIFESSSQPNPETTKLLRVDPTIEVVPENLLKIYLTFSAPMSRGQVYQRTKLLDQSGKPLDLPFLELGEELWDRSQTRITLLFDPGRIKSGLKPREDEGPILLEGRTYTLVVDAGWPDAKGKPLQAGFRRTFKVGPPDTTSPVPKRWKLTAPASQTQDALIVEFGETLDRALASRLISVRDASGEPVNGEAEIDNATRSWRFRPAKAWATGEYRIAVEQTLEDLAGNSVAKTFEVDTFLVDRPGKKTEPVELPFQVRPKSK